MLLSNLTGIWMFLFVLAVIWTLVWMGIAMWRAARKRDKVWFVVFLLVHTLGLLEILYIFWFSKNGRR